MPQLDQVTFLSQLWWCFFFFLGFYFVIHKYFLPKMSRILKLRKKKITMSQDDLSCEVFTKMDGVCSTIPVGWSRATAFPFLLARTKAFRSIDKALRAPKAAGRNSRGVLEAQRKGRP